MFTGVKDAVRTRKVFQHGILDCYHVFEEGLEPGLGQVWRGFRFTHTCLFQIYIHINLDH